MDLADAARHLGRLLPVWGYLVGTAAWKRREEAFCSPCKYTGAAALSPNYADNTRVIIDGVDVTDGSVPMLDIRRGDKVMRMTVTGVRYEDES